MAIHEKARSTRQAQLLRLFPELSLYGRGFNTIVQALVKLVAVQLKHTRVSFQFLDLELLAIKKHIVILPELSLLAGASGRPAAFCEVWCIGSGKSLYTTASRSPYSFSDFCSSGVIFWQ